MLCYYYYHIRLSHFHAKEIKEKKEEKNILTSFSFKKKTREREGTLYNFKIKSAKDSLRACVHKRNK